jgi:hypothetical protein
LQVLKIEEHKKMESMFYSPTIFLTPHNYLEWKPKIILQLRCRGLYQITMAIEVEPDSANEKNDFLNRQDMAIGCICMSVSPELFHQVYEESQESNPNELWTILEVLFGNKEDCEDFMQEVEHIEPEEKPLEDQTFYSEESSTQVFTQICIPLIEDDAYSILDFFFLNFMWKIYGMHLRGHMQTLFHSQWNASQETKDQPHTSNSIMIFSEQNLQKKIGYFNSCWENIQFFKKKTSSEMQSEK